MLALVVTFNLDGLSDEDFRSACKEQWLAPIAATPGLVAKTWLADQPENTYGGVYLWENQAALADFQASDFLKAFTSDPRIANINAHVFEVMEELSRATKGVGAGAAIA